MGKKTNNILPLRFQYTEYTSWLERIKPRCMAFSKEEIRELLILEKLDQKYGVTVDNVISDAKLISKLEKEDKENDVVKEIFLNLDKQLSEEEKKQAMLRLQDVAYLELIVDWVKKRDTLTKEKLRKLVNASKLNRRYGVTLIDVINDMIYYMQQNISDFKKKEYRHKNSQNNEKLRDDVERQENKKINDERLMDVSYVYFLEDYARHSNHYTYKQLQNHVEQNKLNKKYGLTVDDILNDISDYCKEQGIPNPLEQISKKQVIKPKKNSVIGNVSYSKEKDTFIGRSVQSYYGTVWVSGHTRIRNGRVEWVRGHYRTR